MRVNINLATQPYQDVRRFVARWGLALALFVAASCALIWFALYSSRQTRELNRQISDTDHQIAEVDSQRKQSAQMLDAPGNRAIVSQSRFINELIARKSFSWTRVFMQLEQVMPQGLHLVSLAPQLNKQNQLELRMLVAGSSRERVVELLQRMESSPAFRNAAIQAENSIAASTSSSDTVQFEITTEYVPQSEKPEADAKTASGEKLSAEVR